MTMIFGVPLQALMGQLLVGLINGSFYALLSLGLAVIFGLLIIGFLVFEPHGLAEVWRRVRRFFHLWPFRN